MDEQKPKRRRHVATGRPHGGARPGAGRKPGVPNALPMGAVKAIRALNMRVPKDATEAQKDLLEETESAIVKVMNGKVHSSIATSVLKAATTIREEIVGPIAKVVDLNAKVGITSLLDEVADLEKQEAEQAALPPAEPKVVEPKGPVIRRKKEDPIS